MDKLQDDVYNFGFILLETLVGAVATEKGEAYLLNEMVCYYYNTCKQLKNINPTHNYLAIGRHRLAAKMGDER